MKIPRYRSEGGTTINSGRSLTTGTQTGGAVANDLLLLIVVDH